MSFTYDETRDAEHLLLLTPAIDAFIGGLQNPRTTTSTCPRQTVFFFPGGMANRLVRATQRFQDGLNVAQTFTYDADPVWVAPGVVANGEARELKMHVDASGAFRDKGDRIIIANGLVNLFGCTPYDGFITWCAANNLDLFVVDWDWRRRLAETVRFFVRKFLPFFQARVVGYGLPDPLAAFSLIGHSFGGMIVNLVLRDNDPILGGLVRAITVATPFYGYTEQLHRWFEGDPLCNGPIFHVHRREMAEVIASLPSLYTLHFLDEGTFNSSPQPGTPEFPLPSYPSMDATTAGLRADAYNPQTNGGLIRYPATTGFSLSELEYARLQFLQLVAPMHPTRLQKFYNIRGVQTQLDQQTPINNTAGSVTWDWISTSFNPTPAGTSPIVNSGSVPGDDTQPAWSACLATNAPARCITVRGSNVRHMFLMNHPRTLEALASILCAPGAAMSPPVTNQLEPASDEDLITFMRWLHTQRTRKKWPRLEDPALLRVIPPEFHNKLPAIAARIMMDILKRPAPPALSQPPGGAADTKPKRPKPRLPKKPSGRTSAPRRRRRRPAR